jgi:hypothetical protein
VKVVIAIEVVHSNALEENIMSGSASIIHGKVLPVLPKPVITSSAMVKLGFHYKFNQLC